MGYAVVIGECFVCHQPFTFNPVRVPSFRDANSVRQPVCRNCMAVVNQKRKEAGLEPFVIPPDAYEPCDEGEL